MDCGEDSFFITPNVLGVADGVGGWRSEGIDPAQFANQLLMHCKAVAATRPVGDPKVLMRLAYNALLASEDVPAGGCTVCLAAVGPGGVLRVANLGDSGLLVIRAGQCVFQAEERSWQFNMPHQLALAPGENRVRRMGNSPEDSTFGTVKLAAGDVIVMGTDGLLDNLFVKEIVGLVTKAQAAGASARDTAEALQMAAFEASLDRLRRSPFAEGAEKHGYHYLGGKPDDITVIVAHVVPCTD